MSGSNNSINYILFSMHSYRVPQNCVFFEPMLMNFLEAGNFGLVQVRWPLDIRWVSLNQWPLSEEMCQVSSCDYRRVTIGMNIFFERGPCIFASIFWVALWSYHRPWTGLLFTAPQPWIRCVFDMLLPLVVLVITCSSEPPPSLHWG